MKTLTAIKPTVYVETSVISYLSARRSQDLLVAARQSLTHQWWKESDKWDLCTSALVYSEAANGTAQLALKRTQLLDTLRLLPPDRALAEVADALLRATALPAKAIRDAEHIALAAIHQVTYVATWNFRHIANPVTAAKIDAVLRLLGYTPSVLCSPEQLLAID